MQGIIVLVKKKETNNATRAYRPISLLNSEYKLLSRSPKNRMERVMQAYRVLSDGTETFELIRMQYFSSPNTAYTSVKQVDEH